MVKLLASAAALSVRPCPRPVRARRREPPTSNAQAPDAGRGADRGAARLQPGRPALEGLGDARRRDPRQARLALEPLAAPRRARRGRLRPVWVGRARHRPVQARAGACPGCGSTSWPWAGGGVACARRARPPTPRSRTSREPTGAPSQCLPRAAPDYGEVKAVHVHHTVSLNDYTPAEAPQIVLAICRYHRNSNGWNDIGYNALVDKYGTIYEGRAGGLDQAVVGAQAQGFNSQTAGIANIGDYTAIAASDEALAATANYIRWKLGVHGQPLSGPGHAAQRGRLRDPLPGGREGHARARDRPPRHRQDGLPGRRALRPARRPPRAGRDRRTRLRQLRGPRERRARRLQRRLRRAWCP